MRKDFPLAKRVAQSGSDPRVFLEASRGGVEQPSASGRGLPILRLKTGFLPLSKRPGPLKGLLEGFKEPARGNTVAPIELYILYGYKPKLDAGLRPLC